MQSTASGRIGSSTQLVEKLVLGCAGAISLQDIRRLDLSRRKISTLDPFVFSKMHELVELDLSGNRVSGFPINLGLRKLKTLNCNKNAFKSVLTLEQFPNLEELCMEDNELGAPDQYIAVYMLPKLVKLNGKDVDIRDTIKTMEDILQSRLEAIWREDFAQRVSGPMKKDVVNTLETDFIEDLKTKVTYGPPSLIEFTHHMLTVLAEKHVALQTAGLRTNELLTATPIFRKVVNLVEVENTASRSPQKNSPPLKLVVGPKKKSPIPVKLTQAEKVIMKKREHTSDSEQEKNGDVPTPKKAKQSQEQEESEEMSTSEGSPKAEKTRKGTGKAKGAATKMEVKDEDAEEEEKTTPVTKGKGRTKGSTKTAQVAAKGSDTTAEKKTAAIKKTTEGKLETAKVERRGRARASKKQVEENDEEGGDEENVEVKEEKEKDKVKEEKDKVKEEKEEVPKPKKKPPPKKNLQKALSANRTAQSCAPRISMRSNSEGYEPIHMLRCHSIENDPTDAKTNVWKCQFEPDPENRAVSKPCVATCGGNTICVVDCASGKVLKKYQHDREKEEFYCVAWTTLEIDNGEQTKKVNILAAAGTRGSIKLLHIQQLMCYAEIKGDRRARPINSLQFHPTEVTWLFCGSEEIVLWDIGTPQGPDLKCKCKKLMRFQAPGRLLGIVVPPSGDFVLAGCENGCYGWNLDLKNAKKDRRHNIEFLLPSKARLAEAIKGEDVSDEEAEGDMIDGLALTSDCQIASKVACDGSIHLWDIVQARKAKPNTRKELKVTPQCTLEWCNSDSVYLDIGAWPGGDMLVSGDDQGKIWVYNIKKLPASKSTSKPPTKKAAFILNWPDDQEDGSSDSSTNDLIINDVAVSSDSAYIVSVTNKNVICIWQRI